MKHYGVVGLEREKKSSEHLVPLQRTQAVRIQLPLTNPVITPSGRKLSGGESATTTTTTNNQRLKTTPQPVLIKTLIT